jgi:hypothetical protein
MGRNSVEATNACRIRAARARRALPVPVALRRAFPAPPAFAAPLPAVLLAAPGFAGFRLVFAFAAAEPFFCAAALGALDPLPELCPPPGKTTINAASVPASHRRNQSA